MTGRPIIALAGAGGDLGFRIARALVTRGAEVRALVRPDLAPAERARLEGAGLRLAAADPKDRDALAAALKGAACVVSALNGLHDVIVERQGVLLDAAVQAGVPRFIPSDYSEDFTKTMPGQNRNLDLRREFMARADAVAARSADGGTPIRITTVLNGAFMDMLGAEMPIIQRRIRRVLFWRSADQPLDFTAKDDVAAFVARAALDPDTPRVLRVAGDTVTVRQIAEAAGAVEGRPFKPLRVGGIKALGVLIRIARTLAPQPRETFPPWQGMQYMRDMFSGAGRLQPLDNARYPDLRWTPVREALGRRRQERG